MDPNEYFKIADFLAKSIDKQISKEICLRTAINRLYYGIFHMVQLELGIIIPDSKINQSHAYVKEQIEDSKIHSDYSELEAYRVDVDYKINTNINYYHYNDALKIQQRILVSIKEPDFLPYEKEDEDYYFGMKDKFS
ncbi:MAG: hypothetical protein ACFFA0_14855 [Promethearchaeota archaeon]